MRFKSYPLRIIIDHVSHGFALDDGKPHETGSVASVLREEIAFLRERVAYLETQLRSGSSPTRSDRPNWWKRLREDVDAA